MLTPSTRCAALYVHRGGPYYRIPGVDCWDEARDARLYQGPHPVVTHPPCGPWGVLSWSCYLQDPALAPIAAAQVRRWGGVLEHPRRSRLWDVIDAVHAGAGRYLDIRQVWYGHRAIKSTRLWLVGVELDVEMAFLASADRGVAATATCQGGDRALPGMGRPARKLTPARLAEWLVRLAESARGGRND